MEDADRLYSSSRSSQRPNEVGYQIFPSHLSISINGYTVNSQQFKLHRHRDMLGLDALDCCYPTSFVSNNDKRFERLLLLSNDKLLGSVRKFRVSVPSDQRTRLGLTKLIREDFAQQVNHLV